MQITKFLPVIRGVSRGVNQKKLIILHHTGTKENSLNGVLNWLTNRGQASAHFVVDEYGKIYQLGNPDQILWHAGKSFWVGYPENMINNYSIGIEVIGPLSNGGFTDAQRKSVGELLIYLSQKYNIPKENILRHKDIAPFRKTDIADSFWNKGFKSFQEYKNDLFKPKITMGKFRQLMIEEQKKAGVDYMFSNHDGNEPLTESDVRELIEIMYLRIVIRLKTLGVLK